jgi:TolB-like protein
MLRDYIRRLRPAPRADMEADGIARAYARIGIPGRPPFASSRLRLLLVCVLLLVAGAGVIGVLALTRQARHTAALDPATVAILPFRVSDADPSFAHLRDDLVHQLASRLAAGGARTADPQATVEAVRGWAGEADPQPEVARRIAARLGSGSLLRGSVTGDAERLAVSGTLVRTRDGLELTTATFTGRGDRLADLLDQLAGAVLGAIAAMPPVTDTDYAPRR